MKVSVIIPTYNRDYCLDRAIQSVLKQSFKEFELIIINDGSDDKTINLLESYTDPRLIYFSIENQGVSAARNFGIRKSQGDWVAFLDSDDEWLPEKLEKQFALADKLPDCPLIHGEEIWMRRGKRVNQKNIHKKYGGHIFERCLPLCLISPSAALIKRSLLDQVGHFDEEFIVCEDYDLWLRITSIKAVGFVGTPIIKKYGGHDDQLSTRYKAMDYWRIKSLDHIIRSGVLSKLQERLAKSELIKKSLLLEKGSLKHNNRVNLDFSQKMLEVYS